MLVHISGLHLRFPFPVHVPGSRCVSDLYRSILLMLGMLAYERVSLMFRRLTNERPS